MDNELAEQVKLARQGDIQAFGYVIAAFQPLVLGITRRYLEPHAAMDAAQETFLAAWRSLAELREDGAFPGWISSLARTQAFRALRRPKADLLHEDAAADNPPDFAEQEEVNSAVRRAVTDLNPAHRAVIERHYLEGRKLEEIAALLDLPLGTVKRRLFEAREKLRAKLAGFETAAKKPRGGKQFPL